MWLVIAWEFATVLAKGKRKKPYNWHKARREAGCDTCHALGKKRVISVKIESKWNLWHESCTGVEKFIFLIKKRGRGMDAGRGKLRGLLLTVVVSKVNLGDRTVLQSSALQGGRVYWGHTRHHPQAWTYSCSCHSHLYLEAISCFDRTEDTANFPSAIYQEHKSSLKKDSVRHSPCLSVKNWYNR